MNITHRIFNISKVCVTALVLSCSASAMAEVDVVTSYIKAESHDIAIKTQGFIEPIHETTISSQVNGQVMSIAGSFEPGMYVTKDTVLISLDKTNYLAELSLAEKSVIDARVKLADEKVQAERAKADWASIHSTKPNELAGRDLYVEAAQAELKAANARLKKAERDLYLTDIRVAYDGVIKQRSISLGDLLSVGSNAGIYVKSDEAILEVSLQLDRLQHISSIDELKLDVFIKRDKKSLETVSAYDIRLTPDLDKQEQQARLRAKIPMTSPSGSKVFLYEFVLAKLTIPSNKKLFAIPDSAFTQRNSVLSLSTGGINEHFPSVVYEYDGKKYCLMGDTTAIEVITQTPDLYWSGKEVKPVKISMK